MAAQRMFCIKSVKDDRNNYYMSVPLLLSTADFFPCNKRWLQARHTALREN